MPERTTLDDTDMRARMRSHSHAARTAASYSPRPIAHSSRQLFQDIVQVAPKSQPVVAQQIVNPAPRPLEMDMVRPQPVRHQPVTVAAHKPEHSKVLMRQVTPAAPDKKEKKSHHRLHVKLSKPSLHKPTRSTLLMGMATLVFLVGIAVSWAGFHTNNVAQAEEAKINKTVSSTNAGDGTAPPSTKPISAATLASYQVAPDMARYIRIPKLKVYARVLQVGVTSTGALGTPTNVFDTAWYTGSAKPGQPGATLIDGHVSSWTSNGVFYGIKNLVAGDNIEIEKGDGTKLEYTVTKTTAYDVNDVDMSALMTAVTPGKSGLNLITCGGKYDSKSGEFTQRIAVFATLNS